MANIAGATSKLTDVEIAADQPVTEALFTKIGANINQNIDDIDTAQADITAIKAVTMLATSEGSFLNRTGASADDTMDVTGTIRMVHAAIGNATDGLYSHRTWTKDQLNNITITGGYNSGFRRLQILIDTINYLTAEFTLENSSKRLRINYSNIGSVSADNDVFVTIVYDTTIG